MQRLARARSITVALFLVCASSWAHSQAAIELQGLRVEHEEGAISLSGKWQFELTPAMEDALHRGIALHFVTEADIVRERWYFYEKRVAHAERYMRLSYLPLTRRWRLNIAKQPISLSGLGLSLGQSYDNLDEVIAVVQRMSQWRIASASDVDPDVRYQLDLKFKLDLNQLPRPLQIGALSQNEWTLAYSKRQPLVLESPR